MALVIGVRGSWTDLLLILRREMFWSPAPVLRSLFLILLSFVGIGLLFTAFCTFVSGQFIPPLVTLAALSMCSALYSLLARETLADGNCAYKIGYSVYCTYFNCREVP